MQGYPEGKEYAMAMPWRNIALFTLLIFWLTSGCQGAYYAVWEGLGKEKRHLLKDNVEKARSDQEEASEQFKDVLTRIKEMYGFEGGDLEKFYNRLKSDYDECERRADTVRNRIERVEGIAADLFKEWEQEINEITNSKLRSNSRRSLEVTKERYARLHRAMAKAESSMEPVLKHLKDYVLYLKHNLNAQAIGALKQEVGEIEIEVQRLVGDMGRSIKEAEDFLKNLE
jgi:hypothetical protein